MHDLHNATDVRREWEQFIDNVTRVKPAIVKRNWDLFAAMLIEHLQMVLSAYQLRMTYEQEADGSYSGSLEGLDLVANAESLLALKQELTKEVVEYAQEFMDEFQLFFNAPNRRQHFPYVLIVLLQPDLEGVCNLIA